MTTICVNHLHSIDEQTAALMIQLQLEDAVYLFDNAKGKSREDQGPTDAELALRLYQQELESHASIVSDRRMTRSIASAVQADGPILTGTVTEEDRMARDRDMAQRLTNGAEIAFSEPKDRTTSTFIEDDELLDKLRALYVADPDEDQEFIRDTEIEEGTESSSWAGNRDRQASANNRRCVACGESKKFFDVARVNCRHEYCRDCLDSLFQASLTDETLFPPRCCRQPISIESVRVFMKSNIFTAFEKKKVEFNTPNRTYCCSPSCSAFIRVEHIENDIATCPDCGTSTCTTCKASAHEGQDCPDDVALQQVLQTAAENRWQRCYSCWTVVELEFGCNHMTCRCGAQFCYVCGERWKTCDCGEWDDHRLRARANQLVDRNAEAAPEALPVHDVPDMPAVPVVPAAPDLLVDQMMRNILENHECDHDKWRYVGGRHRCEECYKTLPQYIFECRQCQLQACNRCRRNRL